MIRATLTFCGAAAALAMAPSAASAQSMMQTGDELRGQTVDVAFADGTRNSVYFGPNGTARITTPDGYAVNGTWAVRNNQLCLMAGGEDECWTYDRRFAANTPMTMSSTCNETSRWTARAVNPMQMPAPVVSPQGERG